MNSMNADTPETDQACGYASNWDRLNNKLRDEVPAEFARKLERERNEIDMDRRLSEQSFLKQLDEMKIALSIAKEKIKKLEREKSILHEG